jgi:hypothetical protein
MPISELCERFLWYKCVNVSRVGFFVLGDEPIKEVKHQKKKIVKVIPPQNN